MRKLKNITHIVCITQAAYLNNAKKKKIFFLDVKFPTNQIRFENFEPNFIYIVSKNAKLQRFIKIFVKL